MRDLTEISVTATVETVLKKLTKANLPVFSIKKRENRLCFKVDRTNVKKVFAIFAHPCYNINVIRHSPKSRAARFVLNRTGVLIGAVFFLAAAAFSQNFIFRIDVTGSGSYLRGEIISVVNSLGVKSGAFYRGLDRPRALSAIMALPDVTFCSIEKRGSVLVIDVQTDGQSGVVTDYRDLKSDSAGKVRAIVAVCGTPLVSEGDTVGAGDVLIGAYFLNAAGERENCLAVGYVHLECSAVHFFAADCESEENAAAALSSVSLYSENILSRSYKVSRTDGKVVYEVAFTYLHTVKINIE